MLVVVVEQETVFRRVGFLTLVLSPVLRASRNAVVFAQAVVHVAHVVLAVAVEGVVVGVPAGIAAEFLVGATDEPLATFDTGSVHTESYLLFSGSDLEMGMRKRYSTSNLRKIPPLMSGFNSVRSSPKAGKPKAPGQFSPWAYTKKRRYTAHLGAQQDGVIEGGTCRWGSQTRGSWGLRPPVVPSRDVETAADAVVVHPRVTLPRGCRCRPKWAGPCPFQKRLLGLW